MEQWEVLDPRPFDQPDSLASVLYTLQFTALRITLHLLAATCLTVRLYALPFMFAYKTCATRVAPRFRLLRNTLSSPIRTVRNLCRLYQLVSSKPEIVELPEIRKPSINDAVSVESILLKRLGIQEYHDTLQEVERGGSQLSHTPTSRATLELAHDDRQDLLVSFKPDIQPSLSTMVDIPLEENSSSACVHDRVGCVTCSLATRNSSVDSHIPKRTNSDDEPLKLPIRQLQAKSSGKLQKRLARC